MRFHIIFASLILSVHLAPFEYNEATISQEVYRRCQHLYQTGDWADNSNYNSCLEEQRRQVPTDYQTRKQYESGHNQSGR